VGRTCRTHGEIKMQMNFGLENLKRRDHAKDIDVNGRIII